MIYINRNSEIKKYIIKFNKKGINFMNVSLNTVNYANPYRQQTKQQNVSFNGKKVNIPWEEALNKAETSLSRVLERRKTLNKELEGLRGHHGLGRDYAQDGIYLRDKDLYDTQCELESRIRELKAGIEYNNKSIFQRIIDCFKES